MSLIYSGTHSLSSRPVGQDLNYRIWVFYTKAITDPRTGLSYYKYSDDYGISWSVEAAFHPTNATMVTFDVDSSNRLHCFYLKNDRSVYYKCRNADGSWTSESVVKAYSPIEVTLEGKNIDLTILYTACYGTNGYCLVRRHSGFTGYSYLELLYYDGSWQTQLINSVSYSSMGYPYGLIEFNNNGESLILYVRYTSILYYRYKKRSSTGILSSEYILQTLPSKLVILPSGIFEYVGIYNNDMYRYRSTYSGSFSSSILKDVSSNILRRPLNTYITNGSINESFYVVYNDNTDLEEARTESESWYTLEILGSYLIFNKYTAPHPIYSLFVSDGSTLSNGGGTYFSESVLTNITFEGETTVSFEKTFNLGQTNEIELEMIPETLAIYQGDIFVTDDASTDFDAEIRVSKNLLLNDNVLGEDNIVTPLFMQYDLSLIETFKVMPKFKKNQILIFSDEYEHYTFLHPKETLTLSDSITYRLDCLYVRWIINIPLNTNFSFEDFTDNYTFKNVDIQKYNEHYYHHCLKLSFNSESNENCYFRTYPIVVIPNKRYRVWLNFKKLSSNFVFRIYSYPSFILGQEPSTLLKEFNSINSSEGWNYFDSSFRTDRSYIIAQLESEDAEVYIDNLAIVELPQIRNPESFEFIYEGQQLGELNQGGVNIVPILNYKEKYDFNLAWSLLSYIDKNYLNSLKGNKILIRTHDMKAFPMKVSDIKKIMPPRYEEKGQKYDVNMTCNFY